MQRKYRSISSPCPCWTHCGACRTSAPIVRAYHEFLLLSSQKPLISFFPLNWFWWPGSSSLKSQDLAMGFALLLESYIVVDCRCCCVAVAVAVFRRLKHSRTVEGLAVRWKRKERLSTKMHLWHLLLVNRYCSDKSLV